MEPKIVRLPNYTVTIEEQSLQQATATYQRGNTIFAEVVLNWSAPQGWNADAEWLITPANDNEFQYQENWERLVEAQINAAAKFHPVSHTAFEVLDAYYTRRNQAAKVREGRHPASKRGDKTR